MIPNRLSERSFRYYEPVIKQVVDTFPNEVRVKPVGLSINTYVARLRDAMLSYNTYRWESNINFGLFQTYYGTFFGVRLIQVHIEGDTVVIGSKKQKDSKQQPEVINQSASSGSYPFDGSSINFLGYLVHHKLLVGPITFFQVSPEDCVIYKNHLEKNFDVEVTIKDNSITII